MVLLDETLVDTVIVPETVAPDAGDAIEIVGAVVLFTVTETAALVAVCPAALEATAESECAPFERAAVFRDRLKGAAVSAAPELTPSTRN